MAYRKVCDTQAGPLVAEALHCSAGLDLDWPMDKEEPQEAAASMERVQMQHVVERHRSGCSNQGPEPDPELMDHIQPAVSVSPHGRFERLQEDPNYISHFTRTPGHKGQRRPLCFLLRYLLGTSAMFVLGLLIGWYTHGYPAAKAPTALSDSSDILEELLRRITASKIDALQSSLSSQAEEGEEARARYLYRQWTGLGLSDVRLSNHTVLLSLPGPTPNTVTDSSGHQCFLPSGVPCDQRGAGEPPRRPLSYAAYSAVGSLKGEVVDVQYGSVEDLRRATDTVNVTNQIAVVKLGQAPLLYKLSLLADAGFGGVLLYVDPCDTPPSRHTGHQAPRVTLNPGGNPNDVEESGVGVSSLLVQPISAFLAKTLLSASTATTHGDTCVPIATPPSAAERKKITLTVRNQLSYKKVFNVVGYLKGRRNPDRHVLIGSRHDSDHGGGASAIMNQLIAALTEQTRHGWSPDRTAVFCSWGGTALGNIGSFEWGKENAVVLRSSAVAYVSLNSPVRGTETLRATASPTLLQLTSDIQRRQLLSCIRGGNCLAPAVSSLQLPGDVGFFANQLAVPALEFAFEQTKADEATSFLSEAQFSPELPETLDPLFKFHETIAKMTAEAILRLLNDPVLPFYPLDIALDIQNKLKEKSLATSVASLLPTAASLRDHAAFFQSETMRPANDPKERDPSHVRMLNDVLRDLEKSFVVPRAPPGIFRNLLYSLPGAPPQFSILRFWQPGGVHCNGGGGAGRPVRHAAERDLLHQGARNQSLALVLQALRSAQMLVRFGLDLFENYPGKK